MGVVTKEDQAPTNSAAGAAAPARVIAATNSRTWPHPPPDNWNFSQDVPSDVIIIVDGVGYALHKFPLVARCGLIRRIVSESDESELSKLDLPEFPGGTETFELAAQFCYGMNLKIDSKNVAALRCGAEYLGMTDEYAVGNLIARTDAYLRDSVFNNLQACVEVLGACHALLPTSERLGIINRCIGAAASLVCSWDQTNSNTPGSSVSRSDFSCSSTPDQSLVSTSNLWIEEVCLLPLDIFHRLLCTMRARGLRSDSVAASVMQYANTWLRRTMVQKTGSGHSVQLNNSRHPPTLDSAEIREQQKIVEKLLSLLPSQKNICPVSFLLAMLKAAIQVDVSSKCKLDLERRIGWQFEQATVDDLLIPNSTNYRINSTAAAPIINQTMFDLDSVSRISLNFIESQRHNNYNNSEDESEAEQDFFKYHNLDPSSRAVISSGSSAVMNKVARLLDAFLAEVAPDANLTVHKFIAFAELMPDSARVVHDGLYRAIDVYLKAHPGTTDLERKKMCSLMDCQKLSPEACAHAAQNERLPVQVVVQVLYFEQMRLSSAIAVNQAGSRSIESNYDGSYVDMKSSSNYMMSPAAARQAGGQSVNLNLINEEQYAAMHRENLELRIEMTKMKLRLQDINHHEQQQQNILSIGKILKKKLPSLSYSVEEADMVRRQIAADDDALNTEISDQSSNIVNNDDPLNIISTTSDQKPKTRFFSSFSKKLGKLNPFSRNSASGSAGLKETRNADVRASRRPRRHSMS